MARGGCLSGRGLDLLNDALTTRSSLAELGFNLGLALFNALLVLEADGAELLLILGVIGPGLLGRVVAIAGSPGQLLLDLGLLRVDLALLLLLKGLTMGGHLLIVRLRLVLDGDEDLSLALPSTEMLLSELSLSPFLLGALLRALALPSQKHSLVEGTCLLLPLIELLVALGLGRVLPLAQLVDDALTCGPLAAALPLLDEAHASGGLAHVLDLAGEQLRLALVSPFELFADRLQGELVLGGLLEGAVLFEALLDGGSRQLVVVLLALDLDVKADGLCHHSHGVLLFHLSLFSLIFFFIEFINLVCVNCLDSGKHT